MSTQMYRLKCEYCTYNRLTDGTDIQDLIPVETCKDCGGSKKYKCPGCGRLLRPRKYNTPIETKPNDS